MTERLDFVVVGVLIVSISFVFVFVFVFLFIMNVLPSKQITLSSYFLRKRILNTIRYDQKYDFVDEIFSGNRFRIQRKRLLWFGFRSPNAPIINGVIEEYEDYTKMKIKISK